MDFNFELCIMNYTIAVEDVHVMHSAFRHRCCCSCYSLFPQEF